MASTEIGRYREHQRLAAARMHKVDPEEAPSLEAAHHGIVLGNRTFRKKRFMRFFSAIGAKRAHARQRVTGKANKIRPLMVAPTGIEPANRLRCAILTARGATAHARVQVSKRATRTNRGRWLRAFKASSRR